MLLQDAALDPEASRLLSCDKLMNLVSGCLLFGQSNLSNINESFCDISKSRKKVHFAKISQSNTCTQGYLHPGDAEGAGSCLRAPPTFVIPSVRFLNHPAGAGEQRPSFCSHCLLVLVGYGNLPEVVGGVPLIPP